VSWQRRWPDLELAEQPILYIPLSKGGSPKQIVAARSTQRALHTLPEARQAVVRLHLAGYDRFEIADLLGWTEAKTRNHLYRSLETMRTQLMREGFDPGRSE
jgi:DNA-directed RNA polymerase specialized sigma24 family protein